VNKKPNYDVDITAYQKTAHPLDKFDKKWWPYIEAFKVDPCKDVTIYTDPKGEFKAKFDDKLQSPAFDNKEVPTSGVLLVVTRAKFYEDYKLKADYFTVQPEKGPPTGQLPSRLGLKADPKLPAGGSNEVVRKYQITWDSTNGSVDSTVTPLKPK
jgi:hypothetical protein